MRLNVLCAADLHLGRRPARLPAPWNGGQITASSALEDLVSYAVNAGVDAVLLAGDVVDQDNRFFEAYGPLGRAVQRLREAGIPLIAVAGNHDHATLHEVAAEVGNDHLVVLGRGGAWERRTVYGADGRARLHVDGWSFPDSRHAGDPLSSYSPAPAEDGAPVIGLLHCDVDATEAHYAPVSRASLAAQPVAAWVLGHIHGASVREEPGSPPILYCGSLLALDRSERGRHGAWLMELGDGRGRPDVRPVPLSRVRYDVVEVDMNGVEDRDRVRGEVLAGLRSHVERAVNEGRGPLEVVVCDVRVTGRTPLHADLADLLRELRDLDLPESDGVRLAVGRVAVETRPALDLHDLARGQDAPAQLARLLLDLDQGDADPDLLDRAAAAVGAIVRRPHYLQLEPPPVDEAPRIAVAALRRQANHLLDELVREKVGA